MWLFKKSHPKEVRAALGILDEIECTFKEPTTSLESAFPIVQKKIEELILAQPEEFASIIQKGREPRKWIWSAVSNVAGDLLESGKYHIGRGNLNPLDVGKGLLSLFDTASDQLVKLGDITTEKAEKQKAIMRRIISQEG